MEQPINIYQTNSEGDNNFSIYLPDKVFRPYEKVLSVGEEKVFLDDASENLIRDGKLHLNEDYIRKVTQYLDDRKFCLIKAPEGRGKTYLSRIIAYNYHHNRGMEVYFLDLKEVSDITVNSIDDKLKEWYRNNDNNYLLVIENVHAYKELGKFGEQIRECIDSKENRISVVLTARPTDEDLEVFSDLEEIVELNPNNDDVNDIIDLFSKEIGREPFADAKERESFVKKIYQSKKKTSGANLRLLKVYLKTWQNHPEIRYVSGVNEQIVIRGFRKSYLTDKDRTREEIEALWFVSSLYQFDAPLHEEIVQDVGNLVKEGLLRHEYNKYHLPHSVDASFLYKSICGYKHKDSVAQMKTFANRFVTKVLESECPRDFENDFKLLIFGLFSRRDEFKEVIYSLTRQDMAGKIIKEIHPGFILTFFRPNNQNNPDPKELIQYYEDNKDWLKPLIQGLSPNSLVMVYKTFKKYLGYSNILKDIFVTSEDLADYLSANDNYKAFFVNQLLEPIVALGAEYKTTLQEHYEKNKALLKPLFLGLSPTSLIFITLAHKKQLSINIVKDIFSDPKDLEDYLSANDNYKIILNNQLLEPIVVLGAEYKTILQEHHEKNKDMLKPLLLGFSPTRLVFIIKAYKKQLNINIPKDIFADPKDLADYLSVNDNYKVFINNQLLEPIVALGDEYRTILKAYYEKNKGMLKPSLLGLSPTKLFFVYWSCKKDMSINIVKDIFAAPKDLEDYLSVNDNYKIFLNNQLLEPIVELGDEYRTIMQEHYEKNKALLKPLLLRLSPTKLFFITLAYKKQLSINIVEDIFVDPKDLADYLSVNDNYKVLLDNQLLEPIVALGAEYKTTLQEHYEKNKALLKPLFLGLSPTSLIFITLAHKKQLSINIVKDIFSDPKDLADYLSDNDNYRVFLNHQLLEPVLELGSEHKTILQEQYEKNKGMLKPLLLRISPITLFFVYRIYKKDLGINIVKDIFADPKDLADYLSDNDNYKLLFKYELLVPLLALGSEHKTILQEHYEKNKALLKPLFLGLSPTALDYVYQAYNKHLNVNIVEDIFNDVEDLEEYMKKNDVIAFLRYDILRDIAALGDDYKRILDKYNAFGYYFYSTSSSNKGFGINQVFIHYFWSKKRSFDVSRINNNRFYFDGVSWAYIHKFVYIIKENMTEANRQQSVGMVRAIVEKVLAKENSLSYASATDLGYFFNNIALVDEAIFQELMENDAVQADIKRRLQADFYSVEDLYLFAHFFSQSWCKPILESRIQNADEAQQEIIDAWHDEIMNKLRDQGRDIIPGSLLEYVHRNS